MKLYNELKLRFDTPIWGLHPELALFDVLLDRNPHFVKLVSSDILSDIKESSFGRKDSPTVEQVLRACIVFPPVRRRSSLASCRIDLHAGRTKSYVKLYICEALEKDIDELFELIMNCPKTAELVSKMLAPPLREAI